MTTVRKKISQNGVESFQTWCANAFKQARLIVLLMCFSGILGLCYYVFRRPVYSGTTTYQEISTGKAITQEDMFKDGGLWAKIQGIQKPDVVEKIAGTFGIEGGYGRIMERHVRRIRVTPHGWMSGSQYPTYDVRIYAYSPELAEQWIERGLQIYDEERAVGRREGRLGEIRYCREEMTRMQAEMRAYAAKTDAFRERNAWDEICSEWAEYEEVPRRLAEVEGRMASLERLRTSLQDPTLTTVERLLLLPATGYAQGQPRVGQVFGARAPFGVMRPMPLASDVREVTPDAEETAADAEVPFSDKLEEGGSTKSGRWVVLPGQELGGSSGWEALYHEKLFLDSQRAEIGKTYLPGHPKIRRLLKRLESVEASMKAKYDDAVKGIDWELFTLGESRKDLQRKLPKVEEVRQRYDALAVQFEALKYGKMPWGTKYADYAKRISIAKMQLEYGLTAPDDLRLQRVGFTTVPEWPVSPNRGKMLVFCVFLGLVLSTAAVFVLEFLDRTIFLLDQAQDDLGLRGLGIVPLVPQRVLPPACRLVTDRRISEESGQRSLVETFRIIRANLLSCGTSADDRQVIMVTSSLPREGKSAVSTNLSMALARAGKKTLLIDADARRGRLQRELGTTGQGLADVLQGSVSMEDVCSPTDVENLDLMGTGRSGSGLPELLASARFREGLAALRRKYDHIIIDTPPVLGLSEACDLLPCVDGVLFVIWAKYTPVREVQSSLELLRANNAKFFGFVLNRVDLSSAGYYYHYYYYSDYYYRSYQSKHLPAPPAESAKV